MEAGDADDILVLLKSFITKDKTLDTDSAFEALIKTFSTEAMYTDINYYLRVSHTHKLQNYMQGMLRLNEKSNLSRCYKTFHEPVYRGMNF